MAWIAACLTASWRIMRRRDFLTGVSSGGPSWRAPIKVVAIGTAVIAALAFGCGVGPTGVTAYRVAYTVGREFNNVTLLQQQLIGRRIPPNARLYVQPLCNRRGTKAVGPGDWSCTVYVYLPQPNSVPYQLSSVEYDVSVQYNGCYKGAVAARVPRRPVDAQRVRTPGHQPAVRRLRVLQHPLTPSAPIRLTAPRDITSSG